MDPTLLEGLKWILTFGATILLAIGAWWGKSMAEDIKKLQEKEAEITVALAEVKTALVGREQLQDERWTNLNSKMDILHKDVQALVHTQLKKIES